jgi:hypothetical protein
MMCIIRKTGPAEKCLCMICFVRAMILLPVVCHCRRLLLTIELARPPLAGTPWVSKSVEIRMTYLPLRWSDRC